MADRATRLLPVLEGREHLRFRCTSCGECCKSLRVTVTHHDLRRLVDATAAPCSELVAWLSPDEVDMSGEPESFVELAQGRRLMVLAQSRGVCRLLDENNRCTAYAARPADCRAFPFHLDPIAGAAGARLSLLPLEGCDDARDGAAEAEPITRDDARRWEELAEYQALVRRWNWLARHRGRLRRPAQNDAQFFKFLGFTGSRVAVSHFER